MAVVEDETRKQIAVGGDDPGIPFRTTFDPFNMIMQQINRLDEKLDVRIDKLEARIDGLHQELHNTTRWIVGTIIAVAGVAAGLASWLLK